MIGTHSIREIPRLKPLASDSPIRLLESDKRLTIKEVDHLIGILRTMSEAELRQVLLVCEQRLAAVTGTKFQS